MILHPAPCLDEVVATQLSDILGMKHQMACPEDARELTSRVGMDAVRA